MSDIFIRKEGRAGRITLTRPKALNALSYQMCLDIDAALTDWSQDDDVALLIIDAEGEKAFCAGGDISEMYATGTAGNYDYGRKFWHDEYLMNRKLFRFPKPVATFMQGFTMGGGVGVGCHGSHRIVAESSKIAMPEVGIGLIPDVGGSLLLAQAPGRLGEFLGITGDRMDAADAIYAGFADYYVPQANWESLKSELTQHGDVTAIDRAMHPAPSPRLADWQSAIDADFGGETLADIFRGLAKEPHEAVAHALVAMNRNSPLSMAYTVEMIHRVRMRPTIENALDQEFRFTHRSMEQGDFLEGIRAAIIDKDRQPKWRHETWDQVSASEVVKLGLPLGDDALNFEEETS
ncbi:3-hydroxyisobutyryl-CoA hydrolase [Aestuariibius sp. HNIBRBA575]|uniref:3-hydroxyisobutyryl-CoA hydrolase n=1 Tax=Aestuariibius sp. HNIBRBA575 TaxID=3233343 RepID=UPI0034A4EF42